MNKIKNFLYSYWWIILAAVVILVISSQDKQSKYLASATISGIFGALIALFNKLSSKTNEKDGVTSDKIKEKNVNKFDTYQPKKTCLVNKKESNNSKFLLLDWIKYIFLISIFFLGLFALPILVDVCSAFKNIKNSKIFDVDIKEETIKASSLVKKYEMDNKQDYFLYSVPLNEDKIEIKYDVPIEMGNISDIIKQTECIKINNNCHLIRATRYYANGNVKTNIICEIYKEPLIFQLISKYIRNDYTPPFVSKYQCKREQMLENGEIWLKASYIDKEDTYDIRKKIERDIIKEYDRISHLSIDKDLYSYRKINASSFSNYINKDCSSNILGYCRKDEYEFFKDGKKRIFEYYPSGLLSSEEEIFHNKRTYKKYNDYGKLKSKVITQKKLIKRNRYTKKLEFNGDEKTYYAYSKGKLLSISNENKKEIYSPSGELEYLIKYKNGKVLTAYEFKNGRKYEMTSAQIYNKLEIDIDNK